LVTELKLTNWFYENAHRFLIKYILQNFQDGWNIVDNGAMAFIISAKKTAGIFKNVYMRENYGKYYKKIDFRIIKQFKLWWMMSSKISIIKKLSFLIWKILFENNNFQRTPFKLEVNLFNNELSLIKTQPGVYKNIACYCWSTSYNSKALKFIVAAFKKISVMKTDWPFFTIMLFIHFFLILHVAEIRQKPTFNICPTRDINRILALTPTCTSLFQITQTKNILGKCHFGRRNIGTDPRKFPLFLISRILVSLRNYSDWKCILWMFFFVLCSQNSTVTR
jgi:hypothetical protein